MPRAPLRSCRRRSPRYRRRKRASSRSTDRSSYRRFTRTAITPTARCRRRTTSSCSATTATRTRTGSWPCSPSCGSAIRPPSGSPGATSPASRPGDAASLLALAAEAAAQGGRFWALHRQLLRLRHDDPPDLHAAIITSGLDPPEVLSAIRSGTGSERIVQDVVSGHASRVSSTPALVINGALFGCPPGERNRGRPGVASPGGSRARRSAVPGRPPRALHPPSGPAVHGCRGRRRPKRAPSRGARPDPDGMHMAARSKRSWRAADR